VAASQSPFKNAPTEQNASEVSLRAGKRVSFRLLPLVFILYVVAYLDRVNVSFANLRMSADLGFSDRLYGLGVGMFFVSYVLLEIPGTIIVERWSARKWIARIMISWGLVTIGTGFVHRCPSVLRCAFSARTG
jgi:MFS transporter, ACS family, tartrate transporter